MDGSSEDHRVIPELYFLIAKFLSGGPLKETAKTLLKELESVEVLPRRVDWEGNEHAQSYDDLSSQYPTLSWRRLGAVCSRALQLASSGAPGSGPERPLALQARLSLLSDRLLGPPPQTNIYKEDHSIVRRLAMRSEGRGNAGGVEGGRGGMSLVSPRMLTNIRLQRRTLGHLSAVYCVVFDTSGRYVITGADDLLVKVWSAMDGRLIVTLRGAGAEITDACVSADGALLAAGSVERLVRVWCLATAAPKAVLHAHAGTITSVHWAPPSHTDTRCLASTSTDGSVAFWTCSKDGQFLSQPVQYVERMRPGPCHMICAAWSAGGGFLACGSADQHVRVYQVGGGGGAGGGDGAPRRVLETAVHTDAVDSVAWAHRGLRFVSGSKDGTAAVWSLHATQWRHQLLRCEPLVTTTTTSTTGTTTSNTTNNADKRLKVTMVSWDCSDAYIFTAVSDWSVRVWCAHTCRQLSALLGHRDEAYVLEPHPLLAGTVLSAGHDGALYVWHAPTATALHTFNNNIPGQGEGAIFDAKWGGMFSIAATDSHGHLLLLGLGDGHPLLKDLPAELFFHTDYRPLVRDALGGALDEQTMLPPHVMPPPFLVDVEGAPHPPHVQRLVPGRGHLAAAQLVPHPQPPSSRLDLMIEALAAERSPPRGGGAGGAGDAGEGRGVWRGEGVRHAGGAWYCCEGDGGDRDVCVVPTLPASWVRTLEDTSAALYAYECEWYRREMRRRPLMISTGGAAGQQGGGGGHGVGPRGQRRRPGRRPQQQPRPRPVQTAPTRMPSMERDVSSESGSESMASVQSIVSVVSDGGSGGEGVSVSVRARAHRQRGHTQRHNRRSSLDSDSSCSYTSGKTEESSESSYSDWEAGAELAPPTRARRRPVPAKRYSPSASNTKRASTGTSSVVAAAAGTSGTCTVPPELPEVYRPGEWLSAVSPRKAPYHPQMGDTCYYFRLGHQRYFEAVSEKDVYKVNPRDKPWERTSVNECELVKVIGIKYVIKPPRIACLRLCVLTDSRQCGGGGGSDGLSGGSKGTKVARSLTVKYHDMADVIDFLVLKQQVDVALQRRWGPGDRFRCMIDDSWWTGVVLERTSGAAGVLNGVVGSDGASAGTSAGASGASAGAVGIGEHFLSLRVRWDNGEVERLSPWDLEPIDLDRLPSNPGGSVPVLSHELSAALYSADADEWPPTGDRQEASTTIAEHISQVMSLSCAEPFVAPVDLQLYPSYARVVPYPIDLATIRARFHNQFYRRVCAGMWDARLVATNAEHFNEPHSPIVRQARLVTDLLLHIISNWQDVDVLSKYHELAAAYHSSDDEPLAHSAKANRARRRENYNVAWRTACASVLKSLMRSADAEPFVHRVSDADAPHYRAVVRRPVHLRAVERRLRTGRYTNALQFAADVRRIFSNSRLYNTNKRSRIYSMTVRLSALFESLWQRHEDALAGGVYGTYGSGHHSDRAPHTRAHTRNKHTRPHTQVIEDVPPFVSASESPTTSTSESEPLATTSRRVHAPYGGHDDGGHIDVGGQNGSGGGGRRRADSWDSDVPLHAHRKGKGVGKKSKSSSADPAPGPGPALALADIPTTSTQAEYEPMTNGASSSSSDDETLSRVRSTATAAAAAVMMTADHHNDDDDESSGSYRDIKVLEEEIDLHDVGMEYAGHNGHLHAKSRKRRRSNNSDSSSEYLARVRRRQRAPHTRTRERFTSGSSSSSSRSSSASGSGSVGGRRYESDRSYRPRYSTDDDAPLQQYRQRHDAGPSDARTSRTDSQHRRAGGAGGRGVSLRARVSLRRYNEDSEEESLACIGKRANRRHPDHHMHTAARRDRHAAQSATVASAAAGRAGDHDYYSAREYGPTTATARHHHHTATTTTSEHHATTSGGGGGGGVSISSRGRVRKLTAKARSLLRE